VHGVSSSVRRPAVHGRWLHFVAVAAVHCLEYSFFSPIEPRAWCSVENFDPEGRVVKSRPKAETRRHSPSPGHIGFPVADLQIWLQDWTCTQHDYSPFTLVISVSVQRLPHDLLILTSTCTYLDSRYSDRWLLCIGDLSLRTPVLGSNAALRRRRVGNCIEEWWKDFRNSYSAGIRGQGSVSG